MGYLIEVDATRLAAGVAFDAVVREIRNAWDKVANAYVAAFAQPPRAPLAANLALVRSSLPEVDLAERRSDGAIVYAGSGTWELSEVHRQLCQVGVLVEALLLISELHAQGNVTSLSPTQQSGRDAVGADGMGSTWALEVFGGVNVRNNKKVTKDAAALRKAQGVSHRYFACFQDAWRNYSSKTYEFKEVGRSKNGPVVVLHRLG